MRVKLSLSHATVLVTFLLVACDTPEDTVETGVSRVETPAEESSVVTASTVDPYIWLEEVEGAESLSWAASP